MTSPHSTLEKNSDLLDWVLIAKGIGIILVVIGHYNPQGSPSYWNELNKLIYSFHMPLFFILSGYLFSPNKYSYYELLLNKFKRLIYPFITIAIIFIFIKLGMGKLVHLDHPVTSESIINLFINPVHSYMPLLWFVYSLFLMFLLYPLINKIIKNNIAILILFIAINTLVNLNLEGLNKVIFNFPFFVLGIIIRENSSIIKTSTNSMATLTALITFSTIYYFYNYPQTIYLTTFLLATSGSFLIISLSKRLSMYSLKNFLRKTLVRVGAFSMSIYFFHPLFESTIRIFFSQLKQTNLSFELIATIAILSGVIFPYLAEKHVFYKYNFTKQYFLGLSK